jgi:hypothetical protein
MALKSPAIHVVMTTRDVFDTPFSNGLLYTTQKFHDAIRASTESCSMR